MENKKKLKLKFILNFLLSKFYNILIGKKSQNLGFFEMILQKWLNVIEWVNTFFEENKVLRFKIFYFASPVFARFLYICNQKWSILLHKMIKKYVFANILKSAKKCEKPILGHCSQTCILSSGYITFCRNLQKWK
jgi:hypothetical protein